MYVSPQVQADGDGRLLRQLGCSFSASAAAPEGKAAAGPSTVAAVVPTSVGDRDATVGALRVTAVRARGLSASSSIVGYASNPFCRLRCGALLFGQTSIQKSTNPEWDQARPQSTFLPLLSRP